MQSAPLLEFWSRDKINPQYEGDILLSVSIHTQYKPSIGSSSTSLLASKEQNATSSTKIEFKPKEHSENGLSEMIHTIFAHFISQTKSNRIVTLLNTSFLDRYNKALEIWQKGESREAVLKRSEQLVKESDVEWREQNKDILLELKGLAKSQGKEKDWLLNWQDLLNHPLFAQLRERIENLYINCDNSIKLLQENLEIPASKRKDFVRGVNDLVERFYRKLGQEGQITSNAAPEDAKFLLRQFMLEKCTVRWILQLTKKYSYEFYRGTMSFPLLWVQNHLGDTNTLKWVDIGMHAELSKRHPTTKSQSNGRSSPHSEGSNSSKEEKPPSPTQATFSSTGIPSLGNGSFFWKQGPEGNTIAKEFIGKSVAAIPLPWGGFMYITNPEAIPFALSSIGNFSNQEKPFACSPPKN